MVKIGHGEGCVPEMIKCVPRLPPDHNKLKTHHARTVDTEGYKVATSLFAGGSLGE